VVDAWGVVGPACDAAARRTAAMIRAAAEAC
jgi:hypothetical protein